MGGVYGGEFSRGGGDAGTGEGGDHAGAGDVFPIPSDASCTCTAVEVNRDVLDFSCRQTLASAPKLEEPGSACGYPGPVVTRSACADRSFVYHWEEGDENAYTFRVDRDGVTLYYSATGYVSGCGVNADGRDVGSIAAGTLRSDCSDECNLCGSDGGSPGKLPLCVSCGDDPEAESVRLTLSEYCRLFYCPADLAEARAHFAAACDAAIDVTLTERCETVGIAVVAGLARSNYYFDEAGALVAARIADDVPFGQCGVWSYTAGEAPIGDCASSRTCSICDGTGGAGAPGTAGEGGAAGARDASGLCTP